MRVDLKSAQHFAILDTYNPNGSVEHWSYRVHYFTVTRWRGEPRPCDGLSEVKWFPRFNLPYQEMMADQRLWLPHSFEEEGRRLLQVKILFADPFPNMAMIKKWSIELVDR